MELLRLLLNPIQRGNNTSVNRPITLLEHQQLAHGGESNKRINAIEDIV